MVKNFNENKLIVYITNNNYILTFIQFYCLNAFNLVLILVKQGCYGDCSFVVYRCWFGSLQSLEQQYDNTIPYSGHLKK